MGEMWARYGGDTSQVVAACAANANFGAPGTRGLLQVWGRWEAQSSLT